MNLIYFFNPILENDKKLSKLKLEMINMIKVNADEFFEISRLYM